MPQDKILANFSTVELIVCIDQAISCLTGASQGSQYDPSWCRPRTMSKQEIQTACEQAYHWLHRVKEALEAAVRAPEVKPGEVSTRAPEIEPETAPEEAAKQSSDKVCKYCGGTKTRLCAPVAQRT